MKCDTMENSAELDLHGLMSQLGEFSSYQKSQHLLHGLAWLLAGIHMMSFVFVFPEMDHRCYVEEMDGYNYANINITNEMQMYIPRNKEGKFESCLRFDHFNGSVISCDKGYVYSSAHYPSSRIADWNLVCGKIYFKALLQSIFMIGTLVGSFACGYFADKLGRKPVFCISGILQFLCGIGVALVNDYILFAILMFFYGLFGSAGAVVSSIALTMELVGPSKRNTCGTFFTMLFGAGAIVVAVWAYFLRVQAYVLQLIFASHSLLLFGHFWFMDESICWLWSKGKRDEALNILRKAMKCNGKELNISLQQINTPNSHCNNNPDTTTVTPNNDTSADESKTCNLFCYPKLRQRTLVMIFCWFASCLTYLGLSFNSVNLIGNPYAMFIFMIIAEIPGHLISIFGTAKTGNKPMFGISLLISGSLCIVVPLLPRDLLTTILTLIAKVSATVSFNVINSYTAELFPTNLRNTAIGFCMMSARTGGALIPIINLMATTSEGIPTITFGVTGTIAGVLTLCFLPETMNKEIPQKIEDVEKTNKSSDNC